MPWRNVHLILFLIVLVGQTAFGWNERTLVAQDADVRTFVHQQWIEGIPSAQAEKYLSDTNIKTLAQMLQDPKETRSWPNIVALFGYSDSPFALQALEKFICSGKGALPTSVSASKASAVLAIGQHVEKKSDPGAIEFLKNLTNPSWIQSNIGWWPAYSTLSKEQSEAQRNRDLVKKATLALASETRK